MVRDLKKNTVMNFFLSLKFELLSFCLKIKKDGLNFMEDKTQKKKKKKIQDIDNNKFRK